MDPRAPFLEIASFESGDLKFVLQGPLLQMVLGCGLKGYLNTEPHRV